MNRKGVEMTLNVVVIAVIVLVVLAVVLLIFSNLIKGPTSGIACGTYNLNHDTDGDGVVNQIDPCPCKVTCSGKSTDGDDCKTCNDPACARELEQACKEKRP